MTDDTVDAVFDAISAACDPLHERIKALETQVAALKAAPPAPRWLGVWRADNAYVAGDLVTQAGGLWLACRQTSAKPGTADGGWTLIVKSGEGARA